MRPAEAARRRRDYLWAVAITAGIWAAGIWEVIHATTPR